MSEWSKNNRAHVLTWLSLYVLDQLQVSFKEAAALKVSDLTFWNTLASDDLRRTQAQTIGIQLDNMFRVIYLGDYEEDVEREAAIRHLQEALAKADTALPALGRLVDDHYDFAEAPNV